MPVDVDSAESKVAKGEVAEYYGFDPGVEYVIRTKNRDYQGTTQRYYQFVGGQVIAGAMRSDATEEQKWNRGERLAWFTTAPGYRIYLRGDEPSRADEPMWAGMDPEAGAETGEADTGETRVAASWPAAPAKNEPKAARVDGQGRPVTSYPVANSGPSGEAAPTPTVTRTRGKGGKAVATATAPAETPAADDTPKQAASAEPAADSGEAAVTGNPEASADGPGPSFAFPQA